MFYSECKNNDLSFLVSPLLTFIHADVFPPTHLGNRWIIFSFCGRKQSIIKAGTARCLPNQFWTFMSFWYFITRMFLKTTGFLPLAFSEREGEKRTWGTLLCAREKINACIQWTEERLYLFRCAPLVCVWLSACRDGNWRLGNHTVSIQVAL